MVKDATTRERLRSRKEWKRLRCQKHATGNDRTTASHRKVAHVRFASVYHRFRVVDEFMAEVRGLLRAKERRAAHAPAAGGRK